ncbi:unnamed protein product [Echinostoma caproni]|uniref:HTH CENPB-type domain-containing protein n=1 Tax=Echinostoma caproni TaxID=27848 RepID=A0A183AES7_9TREM|nr:unnamed protein product [Echinostoma caproni]
MTQTAVAKHFGVSRKTVQNVISNRTLLEERSGSGFNRKRCQLKVGQKFDEINNATYQWFIGMREKHGDVPLVEDVICWKAMEFATALGKQGFKASRGWFNCWKNRFGLSSNKQTSAKRTSNNSQEETIVSFLKEFHNLKTKYTEADIFNAEETTLYYHILPEGVHTFSSGAEGSKARLTVVLCCSASGDKLPPWIIGKSENPRCFDAVDRTSIPCTYRSSERALMTCSLWLDWLTELDERMMRQKRNILLIVDNMALEQIGAHLTNVKLLLVPSSCMLVAQPMHHGIIWSFKNLYRTMLLNFFISGMEENIQQYLMKRLDILKAMHFIRCAWSELQSSIIANSFVKAGLVTRLSVNSSQTLTFVSECLGSYETIDDKLLRNELNEYGEKSNLKLEEDDEEQRALCDVKRRKLSETEDDLEFPEELTLLPPTATEVMHGIQTLKVYALMRPDTPPELMEYLIRLSSVLMKEIERENKSE